MHFLDLAFGFAARGPRFFADGWGDRSLCETIDPVALARARIPLLPVSLRRPKKAHGGFLFEGTFESPEARLPECSRRARIRMLLPDGDPRAVVVHLAASGDQGFALRLRFAAPLLARGIGAVVLENALYGSRRPPDQVGPAVRSISNLHLMGSATFLEGRALLRWIRDTLGVPLAGVTGFSMGGQFAAMVAASVPFPVAVVPIAAPCSPDSALRDGVLRHVAHWGALAATGEDGEAARRALCAHLARFSVTSLPPPAYTDAAIVVGASGDGVVPPSESRRIAEHWGAELRWLDAGHVTAVLRRQGDMREAIADAVDRLGRALAVDPPRPSDRRRRRARGSALRSPGAPQSGAGRARRPGRAPAPRT
jgi:dienelactone hydrolase